MELGEPGPVTGRSRGRGEAVAFDLEALFEVVDLVLALLDRLITGRSSSINCGSDILPVAAAKVAAVEKLEAVRVGVEQGVDGAVAPLLAVLAVDIAACCCSFVILLVLLLLRLKKMILMLPLLSLRLLLRLSLRF